MKPKIMFHALCMVLLMVLVAMNLAGESVAGKDSAAASPKHDSGGDRRGCIATAGSSVPYPVSGPVVFSEREQADAKGALPMDLQGTGVGSVAVSNEDDKPTTVVFLGEDGKPKGKMFVRPGETASMDLREGSYDALYDNGADWRGDAFGACSVKGKVKGIVVVAPGKASRIAMYGLAKFVVANRLDPLVAIAMDSGDKKRREAREADAESVARSRPERESRPLGD